MSRLLGALVAWSRRLALGSLAEEPAPTIRRAPPLELESSSQIEPLNLRPPKWLRRELERRRP